MYVKGFLGPLKVGYHSIVHLEGYLLGAALFSYSNKGFSYMAYEIF